MRGLAVSAALVLVAAGCGGSSPPVGGAALVVPADVNAFVAVSAGAPLDQLREVMPREAALVAKLRRTVGGEIDVAELRTGKLVALTRGKAGWTPRFAGDHLADLQAYRDAQSHVDGGARIRGYLAPAAAERLVLSIPGQVQIVPNPTRRPFPPRKGPPFADRTYRWAALELTGGRFTTLVRSTPPTTDQLAVARLIAIPSPPYAAHLLDEIPADATYVADIQLPPSMFENTDPATLPARLRRAIAATPLLSSLLDEVLGGETALYRRAGGEVTLVTQPPDLRIALGALGEVLADLGIREPVRHAVLGGELIVSTSQRGIDAFRGDTPRLAADAGFRAAAKAAELPPETTGLVYETSPTRVAWADHAGALTRFVSVVR